MTERRIFTMAQQVASALVSMLMFVLTLCGRHVWLVNHCHKLFAHIHHFRIRPGVQSSSVSSGCMSGSKMQEFLHSKDLLHGNIRARSVLVTREYTAKLWGLHGVFTRKNQGATQRDDPSVKKWQAPELLAKRPTGQSSDMWVCG